MSEKAPERPGNIAHALYKPCPFCGVRLLAVWNADGAYHPFDGCLMQDQLILRDKREAWNRRADIAWLPEDLVERLRKAQTLESMYTTGVGESIGAIRAVLAALEP